MALVEAHSGLAFLSFFYFFFNLFINFCHQKSHCHCGISVSLSLPFWLGWKCKLPTSLLHLWGQPALWAASSGKLVAGTNVIYFLESHSRVSTIGAHFRTKDKGEFLSKWLFLNSFIFDTHNETPICLQAAGSLFPVLCTVDLSTSLKEQLQTSQKLASVSSRRTVSIGT